MLNETELRQTIDRNCPTPTSIHAAHAGMYQAVAESVADDLRLALQVGRPRMDAGLAKTLDDAVAFLQAAVAATRPHAA